MEARDHTTGAVPHRAGGPEAGMQYAGMQHAMAGPPPPSRDEVEWLLREVLAGVLAEAEQGELAERLRRAVLPASFAGQADDVLVDALSAMWRDGGGAAHGPAWALEVVHLGSAAVRVVDGYRFGTTMTGGTVAAAARRAVPLLGPGEVRLTAALVAGGATLESARRTVAVATGRG